MFTDEDKWIPIAIGHLSNSGNQNKSIQKCSIVMVSNFGFITRSILLLSFQEVTTYSSGGIRKIIENQKGRLNWVKKKIMIMEVSETVFILSLLMKNISI